MNIEQVPIYDIKPYENNAKKHGQSKTNALQRGSLHGIDQG